MNIQTKAQILEILQMPEEAFRRDIMPLAADACREAWGGRLLATAMLGYSNICKNQCLYCGMRAGNNTLHRYRLPAADIIASLRQARDYGFTRAFLISGEDPKYPFADLLQIVEAIHGMGMFLSLATGEFEPAQYAELKGAGADEYVLKFEMADPVTFDRLNPSTNFQKRMAGIRAVQKSGLQLASGNIVDYPGQTLEQLADDILLMKELEISWAPIIPYMPAANTPLAQEGGFGSTLLNLKEIAILRLMMPKIKITDQQPGEDKKKGLADPAGNLDAIHAGANLLFCDLLPEARARDFRVVDERNLTGTAHLTQLAEDSGLELWI